MAALAWLLLAYVVVSVLFGLTVVWNERRWARKVREDRIEALMLSMRSAPPIMVAPGTSTVAETVAATITGAKIAASTITATDIVVSTIHHSEGEAP